MDNFNWQVQLISSQVKRWNEGSGNRPMEKKGSIGKFW